MKTLEILKTTRSLIQNGWTQIAYARDVDNISCHYLDAVAKKFCLYGALCKTAPDLCDRQAAASLLREQLGDNSGVCFSLAEWNDTPGRTAEEVVQLLDVSISRLEKEHTNDSTDI